MKYRGLGFLFLAGGLLVWACGALIARKSHAKANYRTIGHVRFTWSGLAYIGGCVLSVFGACFALVSLFLIFG